MCCTIAFRSITLQVNPFAVVHVQIRNEHVDKSVCSCFRQSPFVTFVDELECGYTRVTMFVLTSLTWEEVGTFIVIGPSW